MMLVTKGATDVTTYFHLRLAADGTDATGLSITNFDLQYVRSGAAPVAKVDATALAATDSAHGDNQAFEIDATDQPGVYRVDWPDAAFATGVDEVILTVKVATAFTESLRVRLLSATRGLAGTALPDAAADAAGGLPISDAGGLDLDAQIGTDIDAILVDTAEIGAAGAGLTNINLPNQTMDIVGNITGNLSGSVGSVTGAVGSVTGNVGGNVTGSVGSVATGGITAASIADDAIDAGAIADGAIDAATFAAGAIDAAAIADGAIDAATFAAGAITATVIATGAIDADAIAADAITAAKVAADVSAEIADQVWEEALADHEGTAGSTAEALADAGGSGASAADIADAVLDEALSGHTTAGTLGKAIADIETDVAAILVDTAEIGTAGAGLTNINLPNQTMDIVGNITGNLSGSVGSVTGAVGSVTGNVGGNVTGSVGSVASGGITAASIATGAVDADALAADAVSEIQSGLATAASLTTVEGKVDAVDLVVDAILVDTAEIGAAGAGLTEAGGTGDHLTALATAANLTTVDTVVDAVLALLDDARSEPGQGAPPVNPDMATKVDYLYKALRNKIEQTSTELKIYADDGSTVDHKATVSDDGTTYTRGELGTGA